MDKLIQLFTLDIAMIGGLYAAFFLLGTLLSIAAVGILTPALLHNHKKLAQVAKQRHLLV